MFEFGRDMYYFIIKIFNYKNNVTSQNVMSLQIKIDS